VCETTILVEHHPPITAMSDNKFDPSFTENVIKAIGPRTSPRNRQVLSALIRHVHEFAREVELTTDEWMAGVKFLNTVGQISDSKRNEGQRISDVLGLESYVVPAWAEHF
jgi:hypothetical protein